MHLNISLVTLFYSKLNVDIIFKISILINTLLWKIQYLSLIMCPDNCSSEHTYDNYNKSTLTPVTMHSSNNHTLVHVDGNIMFSSSISKSSVEPNCNGCAYSTSNNFERSSPLNSAHTNASYGKCSISEHFCESCALHSAVNSDLTYHISNTQKNGPCRTCEFWL